MLQSRFPAIRHSRTTRWIFTTGLILAVLVAGGASAGRASAWAPPLYETNEASDPAHPLVIYLGTNYDSLFKSVDGGLTYVRSSAGMGSGSQVAVTAIYLPVRYPGLLIAATAYWVGTSQRNLVPQGIYLSTNAGLSWFQVSDAVGDTAIVSLALDTALVITAESADGSIQRIPLDLALSDMLQYGGVGTQSQTLEAMALLRMKTGEVELTRRFWSNEEQTATAAALASFGTPSAIQTLVSALGDEHVSIRQHRAMQALESLGEKAVPALIIGLSEDNPVLRGHAAEMLGWIASPSARPALELALADEYQAVRVAAAWALRQIR